MIYLPVSLFLFLLFLLLLPFVWVAIALDVVEIALAKLGFSPNIAFILFTLVILGSLINIPLYIESMGAGVVSIGGAGVFDGIAMCGLFALLLT